MVALERVSRHGTVAVGALTRQIVDHATCEHAGEEDNGCRAAAWAACKSAARAFLTEHVMAARAFHRAFCDRQTDRTGKRIRWDGTEGCGVG